MELRGEPVPTHAETTEVSYTKAPSPPQRQSSMNSYSSMEMEQKMKQFQQEKAQKLLSSRNKRVQEPALKTNQKGSSAPTFGTQRDGRPVFQYPPAFMSSSTLSTAASTFASLELVPEDDVTVDSREAVHMQMQMPPRRQGSDMTLDSQRTSSSTSSAVPIMPQRQLSEQSFASLGSSGRHHLASGTSAGRFNNNNNTTSRDVMSRSDHSRTISIHSNNDDSGRSSSAHSRMTHFAIPQSLFKAPPMPQRQESFSTVGSRSTLASQDSFRSLASGSVASISAASMGSSSQRSTSYRGSCPLIAEAMAAHHAYPDEEDDEDDDEDYDDDIDDESTAVPFTPMSTSVDDFLSKHKPTTAAGTTVSTSSCSSAPTVAEGSAHRRSTNPQITAFLNPLQQGKSYAGKPLAIA